MILIPILRSLLLAKKQWLNATKLWIGFLIFRFAGSSRFRNSGSSFFVIFREFESSGYQNSRNSNIEFLKKLRKPFENGAKNVKYAYPG